MRVGERKINVYDTVNVLHFILKVIGNEFCFVHVKTVDLNGQVRTVPAAHKIAAGEGGLNTRDPVQFFTKFVLDLEFAAGSVFFVSKGYRDPTAIGRAAEDRSNSGSASKVHIDIFQLGDGHHNYIFDLFEITVSGRQCRANRQFNIEIDLVIIGFGHEFKANLTQQEDTYNKQSYNREYNRFLVTQGPGECFAIARAQPIEEFAHTAVKGTHALCFMRLLFT